MPRLLVLLIACCLVLPAQAKDWMLIYGAGQTPQRSVIYADIESLRPVENTAGNPDTWQLSVVEVFESADQPDTTEYKLLLSPKTGLSRLISATKKTRDGKEETLSQAPPELHQDFWVSEAINFAANKSGWRDCYHKMVQADADQDDRDSAQEELLALGYMMVRDRAQAADLSNLTWAVPWATSASAARPVGAAQLRISTLEKGFGQKWATYWLRERLPSSPK
jgi:hypothetical protein